MEKDPFTNNGGKKAINDHSAGFTLPDYGRPEKEPEKSDVANIGGKAKHTAEDLHKVEKAYIERNGEISVVKK